MLTDRMVTKHLIYIRNKTESPNMIIIEFQYNNIQNNNITMKDSTCQRPNLFLLGLLIQIVILTAATPFIWIKTSLSSLGLQIY
jgi:hypothetical protein